MKVDLSKCKVVDKCVTRCGKKVAKVEVYKIVGCSFFTDIKVGLWSIDIGKIYSSRRCAIRGARRFCKLIGFECEVVK